MTGHHLGRRSFVLYRRRHRSLGFFQAPPLSPSGPAQAQALGQAPAVSGGPVTCCTAPPQLPGTRPLHTSPEHRHPSIRPCGLASRREPGGLFDTCADLRLPQARLAPQPCLSSKAAHLHRRAAGFWPASHVLDRTPRRTSPLVGGVNVAFDSGGGYCPELRPR